MQMVNMLGLMDGNIDKVPHHSNSHRKARDGHKDQGRHFVSMVLPLKARRPRTTNTRLFPQKCTNIIFMCQCQTSSISAFHR